MPSRQHTRRVAGSDGQDHSNAAGGRHVAGDGHQSPSPDLYGRPPAPQEPGPTWMGYSVGRWTGATLVVHTIGFNDRAWLDAFGHPRSESMHITERYRRRDFGHMDLEITFDDPKYYTRAFSIQIVLNLVPD